jgi:hypothetical protein
VREEGEGEGEGCETCNCSHRRNKIAACLIYPLREEREREEKKPNQTSPQRHLTPNVVVKILCGVGGGKRVKLDPMLSRFNGSCELLNKVNTESSN